MVDVQGSVALVTGQVVPSTPEEVEKLRRGDERLLAVLLHKPVLDKWNGKEPPPDNPQPQKAHYVKRYIGRPR